MRLFAISDLHLACPANRRALEQLPAHPDDWLILAGDVGETQGQLSYALATLTPRFRRLIWVPGNHDLWTVHDPDGKLRGEAKYRRLVEICRSYGALTPEDPYPEWPEPGPKGQRYLVVPLFLLYDYSLRPDYIPYEGAVDWAAEVGLRCSDEDVLFPDPFVSRAAWCLDRLRYTEFRLQAVVDKGFHTILVNHFPLRIDRALAQQIHRFALWCGTRRTADWHLRYRAEAVIYGHLHIKRTHFSDGVRHEEVSLGYPNEWDQRLGMAPFLRQILPAPEGAAAFLERLEQRGLPPLSENQSSMIRLMVMPRPAAELPAGEIVPGKTRPLAADAYRD
jgi:3',5'-cyclic AMP phosphodiesterase CpdA